MSRVHVFLRSSLVGLTIAGLAAGAAEAQIARPSFATPPSFSAPPSFAAPPPPPPAAATRGPTAAGMWTGDSAALAVPNSVGGVAPLRAPETSMGAEPATSMGAGPRAPTPAPATTPTGVYGQPAIGGGTPVTGPGPR
jgi:hypothetical protein